MLVTSPLSATRRLSMSQFRSVAPECPSDCSQSKGSDLGRSFAIWADAQQEAKTLRDAAGGLLAPIEDLLRRGQKLATSSSQILRPQKRVLYTRGRKRSAAKVSEELEAAAAHRKL